MKEIPIIYASSTSNYSVVADKSAENTLQTQYQFMEKLKLTENYLLIDTIILFATVLLLHLGHHQDLDWILISDFVYQAIKNKNLTVYEKNSKAFIHVKIYAEFGICN